MGKGLERLKELEDQDYVVVDVKDVGMHGACKVTMQHVRNKLKEVIRLSADERNELARQGKKYF